MANRHNDVISASILRDPDVKKLEEQTGKKIGEYSLYELAKAFKNNHKLEENVSVSSATIAAKVFTTIIEGARFFAERWRSTVTIHNMSEEKESIPIMTENDFIVYEGPNKPPIDSGGDIVTMDFDVSPDNTDKNMWISFRKRDLEHKKYLSIENGLRLGGRRFARKVLDDIVTFISNNAATTQAFATDRFNTLTLLVAKIEDAGFDVNYSLIGPQDFQKALITQMGTAGPLPFLSTELRTGNVETQNLRQAADFQWLGYIPGIKYKEKIATPVLNGNVLVYDKASVYMGLYKDITMVDWNDPFKWLQGFDLTMTYQLKTHAKIDDGLGKATGW